MIWHIYLIHMACSHSLLNADAINADDHPIVLHVLLIVTKMIWALYIIILCLNHKCVVKTTIPLLFNYTSVESIMHAKAYQTKANICHCQVYIARDSGYHAGIGTMATRCWDHGNQVLGPWQPGIGTVATRYWDSGYQVLGQWQPGE